MQKVVVPFYGQLLSNFGYLLSRSNGTSNCCIIMKEVDLNMCFVHQDSVVRFLKLTSFLRIVLLLLKSKDLEKYEEGMKVWIYVRKHLMVLFNGLLNRCYCC